MSPCSVLVLSLVLISLNKIDSATIKIDESSSTLEHYPVDSIDVDAKVVSKRSDETSATETNASVEKPNTVIVVDIVDDDTSKEPATTNEAKESNVKSNTADVVEIVDVKEEPKENVKTLPNNIKESGETPHTDSATADENVDGKSKSEADSRIVRNVPITSTSDDDDSVVISGPEYLPPISTTSGPEYLPPTTSGPEYLPPTSTPGPTYLPPIIVSKPSDRNRINPKTVIGAFG